MKPIYKIILLGALILIFFLLGTRNSSEVPNNSNSMLQEKYDSLGLVFSVLQESKAADLKNIGVLSVKVDSLQAKKPIYITKYLQAKSGKGLINGDSLFDLQLFIQLANAADSLNMVNDSIIDLQVFRDSSYISIIQVQEQQLSIKDNIIQLEHSDHEKTKTQLRKEKRKKWIFGAGGLLTGFGLGKVF